MPQQHPERKEANDTGTVRFWRGSGSENQDLDPLGLQTVKKTAILQIHPSFKSRLHTPDPSFFNPDSDPSFFNPDSDPSFFNPDPEPGFA